MALFNGVFRSNELAMDTGVTVILPQDYPAKDQPDPAKVLYLLHGIGGDHTSWTRHTNVERYVREYGFAVVIPEVQRSFYADLKYGLDYFSYITNELPELVSKMFNVSTKPEDSYIAGLSMGGYGAIKCGLTYPDRYAACASFSGALDVSILKLGQSEKEQKELVALVGAEGVLDPSLDLFYLAENLKQEIPMFITCGTEDYLHGGNTSFVNHLKKLNIDHVYEEWQGSHTWDFWDTSVQKSLKFFNNL